MNEHSRHTNGVIMPFFFYFMVHFHPMYALSRSLWLCVSILLTRLTYPSCSLHVLDTNWTRAFSSSNNRAKEAAKALRKKLRVGRPQQQMNAITVCGTLATYLLEIATETNDSMRETNISADSFAFSLSLSMLCLCLIVDSSVGRRLWFKVQR